MNSVLRNVLCLSALAVVLMFIFSFTPQQEKYVCASEEELTEDSVVNVVSWFNVADTMTYWIHEGQWRVDGQDTVKTAGIYTKVMITVTEASKHEYKMEYSFLEFGMDAVSDLSGNELSAVILDKINERVKGTVIRFRTDEFGRIRKYDNLKKIKKQAKELWTETICSIPLADSLAALGIDMDRVANSIDADALVQGYVEELEMLFQFHGSQFYVGEETEHVDESDTEYEADAYYSVWYDPDTYEYGIVSDVINYIPSGDVKALLGELVGELLGKEMASSVKKEIDEEFDGQVGDDATYGHYFSIKYFPDGWPEELLEQQVTSIGERGKLVQKYIYWDYRSVGN